MEEDFWELDFGEAKRYMLAANIRQRDSAKMQAINSYKHAQLMVYAIARGLGEKVEFPELHALYPELFGEKDKEDAEIQRQNAIAEKSINNFMAFASNWNARFEEESNE